MPMVWNSQADAQLLSAIIQVYGVKVSGPKLQEIATMMGPDCTPKALTHRLAKIRSMAKAEPTDDSAQETHTTTATKARGKRAAKATATAGTTTTKGASRGKKAATARTPSSAASDNDDEEGVRAKAAAPTPPPSTRPNRKGSKRDYRALAGGDSDDGGDGDDGLLSKRVKIEVGEDIGEGLRQRPEQAGSFFEDAMEGSFN